MSDATKETIARTRAQIVAPMRRIISDRYGNRGVPAHFWLGVTCEDNRVKRNLDIMRKTKDKVGDFTAFVSVEPIVAPCDKLDFAGIDWVLTGGESGPHCRPMEYEWLEAANEKALSAGIAARSGHQVRVQPRDGRVDRPLRRFAMLQR